MFLDVNMALVTRSLVERKGDFFKVSHPND